MHNLTPPLRRCAAAAVLTALFALVVAGLPASPAAAHTELRSSTPAKNATVASPRQVVLVFSETLRPELVKTQILDGNGGRHESGRPAVDGGTLTQQVRGTLPAGAYAVVYWVISADGHPVKGEVPFTVTGPAGGNATPPAAGAPSSAPTGADSADGTMRWVWAFAGLVAGAGIGFGLVLWRKRASGS